MLQYMRRLIAYDDWANDATLTSLRVKECAAGERLLAHIAGAEVLWLARILGTPSTVAVWPEFTSDECEEQLADVASAWHDLLDGLRANDLSRPVEYKNSKGEEWTSTIGDILTHVVMHSAHHRGQIAAIVSGANGAPAYTDFIHCTRQELLEDFTAPALRPKTPARRASPRAPAKAPKPRSTRKKAPRRSA